MKKNGIWKDGYVAIEAVIASALILSVGFFAMMNFTDFGFKAQEKLTGVLGSSGPVVIEGITYDSNGYASTLSIDEADISPLTDFILIDMGSAYRIAKYVGTRTDVIIPKYNVDGKPITVIDEYAFRPLMGQEYGLDPAAIQLTSVAIPNSIKSIGSYGFALNLLDSLIIPNSVTQIGSWAFVNNGLTNIVIEGSVESIGLAAFSGNQINTLILKEGIKVIGDNAFIAAFSHVEKLTIPSSVIQIGSMAFRENSIGSVEFLGNVPQLLQDDGVEAWQIFYNYPGLGAHSIKVPAGQLAAYQAFAERFSVATDAFYE